MNFDTVKPNQLRVHPESGFILLGEWQNQQRGMMQVRQSKAGWKTQSIEWLERFTRPCWVQPGTKIHYLGAWQLVSRFDILPNNEIVARFNSGASEYPFHLREAEELNADQSAKTKKW